MRKSSNGLPTSIDQLKHDKKNPRKHGPRNRAVTRESLEVNGPARSIVIDEKGRILVGNGVVAEAKDLGIKRIIPVEGADDAIVAVVKRGLTEKQKRQLAVYDNRAGELGEWDADVMTEFADDELMDFGTLFDDKELAMFIQDDVEIEPESSESEQPEEEEHRGIYAFREDAIFPSSNEWGIPDLREDRLATVVPVGVWGGEGDKSRNRIFLHGTASPKRVGKGAVLAFYVEDHRFEAVWNNAVEFVETLHSFAWSSVITPDFSLWRDDPLAVQIFNLYRSRWVARYWQEAGIKVIPNIGWSDERTYGPIVSGIPQGCPVISVQCRTTRDAKGQALFLKGINHVLSQIKPKNVVLYGGVDSRSWIEPGLNVKTQYHWLSSWTTERRRKGAVK